MRKTLQYILSLVAVALIATACSENDAIEEPIPEGYGRLTLRIATPEMLGGIRGVTGTWTQGTIRDIINSFTVHVTGPVSFDITTPARDSWTHDALNEFISAEIKSQVLPIGTYTIYGEANFGDLTIEGTAPDQFVRIPANYMETATRYIPMSAAPITATVTSGQTTDAGTLVFWRMMAKLEFQFTNPTSTPVKVVGIEVEPVNLGSEGTYLYSKQDLASTANDLATVDILPDATDVGAYKYEPATAVTVPEDNGTASLSFYVNETNASATKTKNQLSIRLKLKRAKTTTPTDADWYDDEIRFGMTTPYTDGSEGGNGFNVIRRNDWIQIPVTLTPWEFRVEMLPYTPIAGYAAYVESADALETTFNTQGYICMRPLFRNSFNDAPGVWHTITDSGITLVLPHAQTDYTDGQYIDSGTNTGIILTGDLGIFDSKFVQLGATENIVANLSTEKGTVTVTLRVKLGGYTYEFSHNVTRK
mgnify:CR=1 FL=1